MQSFVFENLDQYEYLQSKFDFENKTHDKFQQGILFQIKINFPHLAKKTKLYRYNLPKKNVFLQNFKTKFLSKEVASLIFHIRKNINNDQIKSLMGRIIVGKTSEHLRLEK